MLKNIHFDTKIVSLLRFENFDNYGVNIWYMTSWNGGVAYFLGNLLSLNDSATPKTYNLIYYKPRLSICCLLPSHPKSPIQSGGFGGVPPLFRQTSFFLFILYVIRKIKSIVNNVYLEVKRICIYWLDYQPKCSWTVLHAKRPTSYASASMS